MFLGIDKLFKSGKKTFLHGVHPAEHKKATAGLAIRRVPFPAKVNLPLVQHIGTPSKPIIKSGQEVVRGEPIAEAEGFVSVPIHSPVTGVVRSIDTLIPTASGPKTTAITIETYTGSAQEVLYGDPVDTASLSAKSLVDAVQQSGMVGLGGAAFPSHVKLLPPEGSTIKTILVNGCECEPYLTCDHRIMLEQADNLIRGIKMIMRSVAAEKAIIGVEDNKLDAIKHLITKLKDEENISVQTVVTKYPQGAEKMLISSILGKEVPNGSIPAQIGVAVYNVGTLAQIGSLIPENRGLIERVVTVSGSGVKSPGNYLVPLGTPISHLLKHAVADTENSEIIIGGPMMGMSTSSLDVVITKGVSGVVVLSKNAADLKHHEIQPCIKCGSCLDACPVHLNPSMLGQLAKNREYAVMENEYHLNSCFECGSCSYVCPSNIPLTQYFRIAKAIQRESKESAL